MDAFIVVYCIYFVFLISAAVWFLRRCVITDALKNLRGLSAEARYNDADNSVSVKNNFTEFYLNTSKALRKNFPLLVLKQICADIEEGKNYGARYLSRYKKYHTKFLTLVALVGLTAPLLAVFTSGVAGYSEYIAAPLIACQSVIFLLIGVLRYILARNFDSFTEIFYTQWYDALLDFDTMRFSILKNKFEEEEELRGILSEMQTVYTAQSDALSHANTELAAQIQRLADEKQNGNLVTAESIAGIFEANFNRIETFCANMEASVQTLETSFKNLPNFTGKNKKTLDAVNKLTGEFAELRNALLSHTNAAETVAIEKLDGISATLENDVRKTWTSIDETLNRNAKELSASYKHFFELCKTLSGIAKNGDAEW